MSDSAPKRRRSLASIATIVAIATLISKVVGLVRQQSIAAEFGVGPEVDAYNFAYVIPSFLFILLGGVNGPFHSSVVSVLAKHPKKDAAALIETVNTLVGILLLLLTAGLMLTADPLITMLAPGVSTDVHTMAVEQLRIMAPLAFLSGLIGIGFGTLVASDQYWLPSISPLLSSVTVIIGVLFLTDHVGASVMAWGTLAGGLLQWLVQIPAQWGSGMGTLRLRFDFNRPGVKEIGKLMGPATLSSGMLLISVAISLFFASQLKEGSASALTYAQLLFLTPLGILSNVILVPYMPIFSQLAAPESWTDLKDRIRQSLVLTAMSMMPTGALMSVLALPAVRIVYQRGAFDDSASQLVASLLVVYAFGMFFYLGRDIFVRVFYALGDGNVPLLISLLGLFFNAIFCFFFTKTFGAPGLAMATVGVQVFSMAALVWILNKRLHGLPWATTGGPILALAVSSLICGFTAWIALYGCQLILGTEGIIRQLVTLSVSAGAGLLVFAGLVIQLKLPEMDFFVDRLRQKLPFLTRKS
ncbi:murein biosynthesis integral membrane protein MurJ [Acaryochloris marina NIES-2412]|uniref:murein biosynthesis integral membrane protein MurJ n=1 Tax=Acaryochloris marina TaxID=155978 RepID=UPI00405A2039